ncbi:hypothetical protein [Alteromonas macleodii]|uniref:hypothetical protein n=1 Tax=Alteromonas macleodii TaxID=28108 RepID=UPI003140335C|tara:strand:+ start:548 stop:1036 length:489 start_codon:yes stop_codon:yes gene_type:complete
MGSLSGAVSVLNDVDVGSFKKGMSLLSPYVYWPKLSQERRERLLSFLERHGVDIERKDVLIRFLSGGELTEFDGKVLVGLMVDVGELSEEELGELHFEKCVSVTGDSYGCDLVPALIEREKERARMRASSKLKERQYPGADKGMSVLPKHHQAVAMRKYGRR